MPEATTIRATPEATIIRALTASDMEASAAVVRAAFVPQAQRFGLTQANCPGNGAFVTRGKLAAPLAGGAILSGSFTGARQTGFIAVKRAARAPHMRICDGPVCYLEKLAVLPEEQRRGAGESLLLHGVRQAAGLGAQSICIGIIAEARELSRWYEKRGFVALGTKNFASLPFTVLYMGRELP